MPKVPTSSQALVVGHTLLDSQDGETTNQFGQEVVLANHSVAPASKQESQTSDTSGQPSTDSFTSVDLQSYLASKLRVELDANGSPEYVMTWKEWDMSSGPLICALQAYRRRTFAKDYFGWPSPTTMNACDPVKSRLEKLAAGETTRNVKTGGEPQNLHERVLVLLSGGRPPREQSSRDVNIREDMKDGHNGNLEEMILLLSGWSTPTTTQAPNSFQEGTWTGSSMMKEDGRKHQTDLQISVLQVLTGELLDVAIATIDELALNPAMSRWLMGYPQETTKSGWDNCSPDWESWESIQIVLDILSKEREQTRMEDSGDMATPSCRKLLLSLSDQ